MVPKMSSDPDMLMMPGLMTFFCNLRCSIQFIIITSGDTHPKLPIFLRHVANTTHDKKYIDLPFTFTLSAKV